MATGEADGLFYLWSGPASIRGPTAFQAVALPTELPDPPLRHLIDAAAMWAISSAYESPQGSN